MGNVRNVLGVLAVLLGCGIVWLIRMDLSNAIDIAIGAVFAAVVCELLRREDEA